MTRRMSVFLTQDAVRAQIKTVTRRGHETWTDLAPGDRLVLIEKGQGLKAGERQVVVAEVEVVDVRVERLSRVTAEEVRLEGLAHEATEAVYAGTHDTMADWFVDFWAASHGYKGRDPREVWCRRIEWRYLPPPAQAELALA